MEIRVYDYKLYMQYVLGMCGEVRKNLIIKNLSGGHKVKEKKMKELLDEKIIRETSPPQKVLRLTKPKGLMILNTSKTLKDHYNKTTNNHSFHPNEFIKNENELKRGEVIFAMITNDIPVDGIRLSYEHVPGRPSKDKTMFEVFEEENRIEKNYRDILSNSYPGEVEYFTSVLVKKHNTPTLRINPSRAKGHLTSAQKSYAIYWKRGDGGVLNNSVETMYKTYLEKITAETYGNESQVDAIIFIDKFEDIEKIYFAHEEERATTVDLSDVYKHAYYISLEDPQKLKQLLTRRSYPDERLIKTGLQDTFDGIDEGRFVLDLEIPDLAKIRRAEKYMETTKPIIVCEPSQETVYKKLLGRYHPDFIRKED